MHRLLAAAVAFAAGFGSATADSAKPQKPSPAAGTDQMVTDDCAKARKAGKTCVLEVPPEPVTGGVPTAGEIRIRVAGFQPNASLIRLRADFIPEIAKAADDL
jgi:hypothetical protein